MEIALTGSSEWPKLMILGSGEREAVPNYYW